MSWNLELKMIIWIVDNLISLVFVNVMLMQVSSNSLIKHVLVRAHVITTKILFKLKRFEFFIVYLFFENKLHVLFILLLIIYTNFLIRSLSFVLS